MSSPMYDVPDHFLVPRNVNGEGPVNEDEAHHWGCWCKDDADCKEVEW